MANKAISQSVVGRIQTHCAAAASGDVGTRAVDSEPVITWVGGGLTTTVLLLTSKSVSAVSVAAPSGDVWECSTVEPVSEGGDAQDVYGVCQ